MLRGGVWLFCGVFAVCGVARAQNVPRAPAAETEGVVPEQRRKPVQIDEQRRAERPQPIMVGDVILVPRELLAEAPETEMKAEAAPKPDGPRRWYGLPILATDSVAYGMFAAASLAQPTSGVTLPLGVGGFVLGGPIFHLTHRQWGHAGLSLLMRAGLPLVGAALGAAGCNDGGGGCGQGVIGLAVVGMTAATAIDVAAVSYEPAPTSTVLPAVSIGAQHAWLGASGTF